MDIFRISPLNTKERQYLSNLWKHVKHVYYRNKNDQSKSSRKLFWGVIIELAGKTNKNDSFQ